MARVTDDFSGLSANQYIAGQGNWLYGTGNYPTADYGVYVSSVAGANVVGNRNQGGSSGVYLSDNFSPAQFAEAVSHAIVSAGALSLIVRASGGGLNEASQNNYNAIHLTIWGGGVELEVFSDGDWNGDEYSWISVSGLTRVAGDVFRLEIDGTTLTLYKNDVLVTGFGTEGSLSIAATISRNPVLAGGSVGFGGFTDFGTISQFYGGDIAEDDPEPDLIEGATAGAATVTGTLQGVRYGTGATAGATVVTGVLTASVRVFGLSTGLSTVTGTIHSSIAASAATTGVSVVVGQLVAQGAMVGVSGGVALASALLSAQAHIVPSTIYATSTVTATLHSYLPAAASVVGISSLSGVLIGTGAATGVAGGVATVWGMLTEWMPDAIYGRTDGAATVTGVLVAYGGLLTVTNGIGDVGGTLGGRADLSCAILSAAQVIGSMYGDGHLFGGAAGVAVVTAEASKIGTFYAEGRADGVAVVMGWITLTDVIPESIIGRSSITHTILSRSTIADSITGRSKIL